MSNKVHENAQFVKDHEMEKNRQPFSQGAILIGTSDCRECIHEAIRNDLDKFHVFATTNRLDFLPFWEPAFLAPHHRWEEDDTGLPKRLEIEPTPPMENVFSNFNQ